MRALSAALLGVALVTACSDGTATSPTGTAGAGRSPSATAPTPLGTAPGPPRASGGPRAQVPAAFRDAIPGMPPSKPGHVYAFARAGLVRKRIAQDPAYLYVPNSYGAPITTVIDQHTHQVVRTIRTGTLSQHVTPSYDLRTLYVEASYSNRIVALDPATGKMTGSHLVDRPYNLYFTPDGKHAIVMDEEHERIVFADPRTFKTQHAVTDSTCSGPNHADFSANGRYFLVSCEFSGTILKVSTLKQKVIGRLDLGAGSMPQDVRLAPDGESFFVAVMGRDQLAQIPWDRLAVTHRTSTPMMPHGIYPSRDGQFLYVSDRGAGEVSVYSLAKRRIVDTWTIPGGGSPDMGGVSADGRTLWLSGRRDGYVYGWNTRTGKLIAKIYVGGQPHGLLVWPQPGRYSLGHTGNMR